MSRGTWRAIGGSALPATAALRPRRRGDRDRRPRAAARSPSPHDAAEPLQLRCSDGARRLGVLTDLGSITAHMLDNLAGCDALLLECNHDAALLARSRYPASLKARIGGRYGHLSNDTAAEILGRAAPAPRLRHLVAAHLSRENNRPELVRDALAAALGQRRRRTIVVADPRGSASTGCRLG